MMLRNKSPVTAPTATGAAAAAAASTISYPKSSVVNFHLLNSADDTNSRNNCELNQDQHCTTAAAAVGTTAAATAANTVVIVSPQRKPTHRRGYSHGSYSSLSASTNVATNHNTLLINNPPLGYVGGTLGRAAANSLLEVQREQQNESIHQRPIGNHTYLHHRGKEFGAPSSSTTNPILLEATMKMNNSSDPMSSDDNANHHHHHSSTLIPGNNTLGTPTEESKRAIAQIEQKIRRTKEAIKEEQIKCNENVNEYLKLSGNAELTQGQRIKSVFEKNNQKSTAKIARYQKKLKRYDQTISEIKERGVYYRHTRERLRDVGTNIKEGISGLSGGVIEGIKSGIHTAGETVIAKPKEFFKRNTTDSSIEKNNSEQPHEPGGVGGTGGAQGVSASTDGAESHQAPLVNSNSHTHSHSTKCTSDDESSSITSGSGHLGTQSHNNSIHHSNSPLRIKSIKNKMATFNDAITPTVHPPLEFYSAAELEQLNLKIDDRNQEIVQLSAEVNHLKTQLQSDCSILNQSLQDEKYRVERLEEQLNDLTELHQKEIENLKQTITDLEEKIQYQTEERQRDVHEMLESFQTRISRMEHQQHQHLQQLVNLDSLENSNARALVLKLINVLLTILQVILLLVATIANVLAPFLHTRMRIFTSAIVIIIFTFVFQHWPELSIWTRQKIYEKFFYFFSLIPFLSLEG